MARVIDISATLHEKMPSWPGSRGLRVIQTHSLAEGGTANVSRLDCDLHAGTHVDAPWHFIPGGRTVEELSLDVLLGPAFVLHQAEADAITADLLSESSIPSGTKRILFRTRNEGLLHRDRRDFYEGFVALTPDAAQWLVDYGVLLVGVDYLSVQRFGDGPQTHQILLGSDVVVLEGLDLSKVEGGLYELICLPIKLAGADGAPARAVLRTYS